MTPPAGETWLVKYFSVSKQGAPNPTATTVQFLYQPASTLALLRVGEYDIPANISGQAQGVFIAVESLDHAGVFIGLSGTYDVLFWGVKLTP